ncbi:mismatch-specific DNA-glycosylase [Rhodopseudomonas telluris]|uniref:Mismatch-specific DNA-glycosylase n=1 Tax=Rhodopseudomonas telluris TaxID=644215 RepID=A0ABV6ETH4_9BRAD
MVLPDVLKTGLRIVFCGTAAGRASGAAGCYYAHKRNKFWSVLHDTTITNEKLDPTAFNEVVKFGIGLTDLCKDLAGSDRDVRPKPEHRIVLRDKIERHRPTYLAFTSLEAGKRFFGRRVDFGRQSECIGDTRIFVLPSTSPMAAWNWNSNEKYWFELAEAARCLESR